MNDMIGLGDRPDTMGALMDRFTDFRLLGPLSITLNGSGIRIGAPKQRALLVTLMMRANLGVSHDELIMRLWDDDPPTTARAALHVHVARLRALLDDAAGRSAPPGRPHIRTIGGGYLLETPPGSVDLHRFHDATREAARHRLDGDAAAELRRVRAALAEWRGDPSAVRAVPSLARETLARLQDEHVELLKRRFELEAPRRASAELFADLRTGLRGHPSAEALWHRLVATLTKDEVVRSAYRQAEPPDGSPVPRRPGQPATGGPDPAPPAHLPWQSVTSLPSPPGRGIEADEELVDGILAALPRAPAGTALPIVCLAEPPGPRRTATAVLAAHRLAPSFPDGQWYLRLTDDAGGPRRPEEMLALMLRLSGVPAPAVPAERWARANLHRARLADRRVLIVFDDAHDAGQLRDLLPGTSGCAVITTGEAIRPELMALYGARTVGRHRNGGGAGAAARLTG